MVYDKIFTVNVEGKTYYAVCFYEGTNRKEAEAVRSGLIASGGSGYIVNNGKFVVYGAVYERATDAENVAKKQQNGAAVKTVRWDSFSFKCKDSDQAKDLGESLAYFNDSIDVLVKLSLQLDLYEENEALVYLQIEEICGRFYKFSKLVEDEMTSQFLESCYNLLENDFLGTSDTSVKSRLKLIIHELIDFRINTDFLSQ